MVVGPISHLKHMPTGELVSSKSELSFLIIIVNSLLERWKHRFSDRAVLIVVQPVKVENGDGEKQFHDFIPPTR